MEAGSLTFTINTTGGEKSINTIKTLTNSVKTLQSKIRGIAKTSRNMSLAISGMFVGSVYAIDKFVASTGDLATKLKSLSSTTGISASSLNTFAKAGQLAGISTENTLSQISSLQKKLTDVKLGKGDARPFMQLGINPFQEKSAIDAAKKIYNVVNRVPEHARGGVLGMLGLDESFMRIMKNATDSLGDFNKLLLSNKQISQIDKMGGSLRKLKVGFASLKEIAIAKLAPSLTKGFNQLFSGITKNSGKIVDTLSSIAKYVGYFAEAVGNASFFIGKLISDAVGFDNAFKGMALAAGVLVLALSPVTRTLFALFLLLDDIATWKRGGESLLGGFYEVVGKVGNKTMNTVGKLGGGVMNVFGKLGGGVSRMFKGDKSKNSFDKEYDDFAKPEIYNSNLNSSKVSTSSNKTVNNNTTINVNSVSEAVDVKKGIDRQSEMDTAYNSLSFVQ